mmetsp:Transcript_23583/g.65141  ORF Transcript_23583/g.65141 Transcript_23583/m.65141 type:complete len:880 (+) Transcript_23583:1059-3698(+)
MQMVLEAVRGLSSAQKLAGSNHAPIGQQEGWGAAGFDAAAAAAAATAALDAAATALRPALDVTFTSSVGSLSQLVRLLSRLAEVDAPELRATLVAAFESLPAAHYGTPPPDVDAVLRRVSELDHKPARVHLTVRSLAVGIEPDAALATAVLAVEQALVSEKASHGSARKFLNQIEREAQLLLSAVRRSVRHATSAVALSMRGGDEGNLVLHCDEAAVDYGPYVSWLFTPAVRDYTLQLHVREDGQIQLDVSAPAARSVQRPLPEAEGQGHPDPNGHALPSIATASSHPHDKTIAFDDEFASGAIQLPEVPISPLDGTSSRASPGMLRPPPDGLVALLDGPGMGHLPMADEGQRLRLLRLVARRMGISLIVHGAEMCHVSLVQAPEDQPLPPPPELRGAPHSREEAGVDGGSSEPISVEAVPDTILAADVDATLGKARCASESPTCLSLDERLNRAAERPAHMGGNLVGVAEAMAAWDPTKRTGNAPPNPVLPATAAAAAAAVNAQANGAAHQPRVFDVSSKARPRGPRATLAVLENQRRSAPWRPWSSGDLAQRVLADEAPPGVFSEEAPSRGGNSRGWQSLEEVPLPRGAARWVGNWRCEAALQSSDDGWLFAPTWRGPWSTTPSAIAFVRRRRWIRTAEFSSDAPYAKPRTTGGKTASFDSGALAAPANGRGRASADGTRTTMADALAPATCGMQTSGNGAPRAGPTPPPVAPQPSEGLAFGGALLQMRTAPGARLCLRGSDLELSSRPVILLQHARSLIDEHCVNDELSRPLHLALDVLNKYLMGASLKVQSAVSATVLSDGEDGGAFSIHAASRPVPRSDGETSDEVASPLPCLEMENEVLILDLVADVGDLVKAFANNINRVTPNPTLASARVM